jgi:pimeloyl-ACP methyl ester carboxylesterase
MPTFTTYDGTELTCRVVGNGNPLVVVPGGPLRATRYLGDLGGFGPEQELVMLELPPRRVDEIVADVEALREHLGIDRLDLLAHSAGGDLALLYAAAHPDRVRKLALITAGASAVGIDVSDDVFRAALQRRSAEPWFDQAHAAILAWDAGDTSRANRAAAMPFFYGRWDEVAQAHAAAAPDERDPDSAATYYADGAFDPAATRTALSKLDADVLVVVGGVDAGPTVNEGQLLSGLFRNVELVVQPGAGHYPWLDDAEAFVSTISRFLAAR